MLTNAMNIYLSVNLLKFLKKLNEYQTHSWKKSIPVVLLMEQLSTSHLDANKVDGNDGFLQWGQVGFVQRLPHHHFGRHIDEVHTNCFWYEGEGARCPQITFNHLDGRDHD